MYLPILCRRFSKGGRKSGLRFQHLFIISYLKFDNDGLLLATFLWTVRRIPILSSYKNLYWKKYRQWLRFVLGRRTCLHYFTRSYVFQIHFDVIIVHTVFQLNAVCSWFTFEHLKQFLYSSFRLRTVFFRQAQFCSNRNNVSIVVSSWLSAFLSHHLYLINCCNFVFIYYF